MEEYRSFFKNLVCRKRKAVEHFKSWASLTSIWLSLLAVAWPRDATCWKDTTTKSIDRTIRRWNCRWIVHCWPETRFSNGQAKPVRICTFRRTEVPAIRKTTRWTVNWIRTTWRMKLVYTNRPLWSKTTISCLAAITMIRCRGTRRCKKIRFYRPNPIHSSSPVVWCLTRRLAPPRW